MKRRLFLLLAAAIVSSSAEAQEFGRVSGGELAVATKSPSTLHGSLGMDLPFLSGHGGKGYGATLGGTLVNDRLWFFASMQQSESSAGFSRVEAPAKAGAPSAFAKLSTDLGTRHNVSATSFGDSELPSSFLSLRYTGIVSNSMFFTATISRTSSTRPALLTIE